MLPFNVVSSKQISLVACETKMAPLLLGLDDHSFQMFPGV